VARRGTFGRLPRAAPDLTNTLVALIREANAQEDQNMVDAWKNGGKVEGKGVDDDRLLEHMKKRRDTLDPSDPMWDEWNNNYIQYDFSINESKMALKNDQGKVSDEQMAAFYRKWAGRSDVQQDSEFYRSLLSRAAKWHEAAKGRSAGRAASGKAEAHTKWRDGYYKANVQGAETATGYLLLIAQTYGAAPPNASSLDDINPNSAAYGRFRDVIDDGKAEDPIVQGLINEMNSEIKKVHPNWSYSESNLTDLLDRGDKGLDRLIKESTTKTETNDWTGRKEKLRYEKTRVKQTRANERVQIAADTYALDLDNCQGDPYCARNMTSKFRDALNKEAVNIVAGLGGVNPLTGSLQDTRTASALVNTIVQLDGALGSKSLSPTAAAAAVLGGGAKVQGYTIFDAAAGSDSATNWLADTQNGIKQDMDRLDRGGWIMTEPNEQQGVPILDGLGRPTYRYTIYDPNTPKPDGAVAVPGVAVMTDNTRTQTGPAAGPTGVSAVTRAPVVYIMPSPPNVTFVDPGGRSIDPKVAGEVRMFDGTTAVPPPWTELRGVKGPDGVARTLYRTGDGTPGREYLFHEHPPVPQETKPNAAGQYVIPVVPTLDKDGKQFLKADISEYVRGVGLASVKLPSGNYVMGTYTSAGAARTSAAISDLYTSHDVKASEKADTYLRQFERGLTTLSLTDPERIAGMRDLPQLAQTATLYKTGGANRALAEYETANALDPTTRGYADQLTRAGFTAQSVGQDEVDRRILLLRGIDAADARIASRPAPLAGGGGYGGFWGMSSGGRGLGLDPRNAAEQALLAQQKRDVLNPLISVSSIKVPGMPALTGQPPTSGVGGYYMNAGGFLTPQPFTAPGPLGTTGKPPTAAGPPKAGTDTGLSVPVGSLPSPTTAALPKGVLPERTPPPTPPPPTPNPTANPLPGVPKGYTGPRTALGSNRVIY
jgi:hypothetical protein